MFLKQFRAFQKKIQIVHNNLKTVENALKQF